MTGRYCAILPSPEKLDTSITSPGLDETNTRNDFKLVLQWLTDKGVFDTGFYVDVDQDKQLEDTVYKTLIRLAFNQAFAPIRNTKYPEEAEIVLLYYTGHGLGPQGAKYRNEKNPNGGQSSFPLLVKVGISDPDDYFAAALPFLDGNPTVKGGELCLHDVGFCDLQGLLTPWIAAVKADSTNAPGKVKKNKHLVVIADSCYSGVLVQPFSFQGPSFNFSKS